MRSVSWRHDLSHRSALHRSRGEAVRERDDLVEQTCNDGWLGLSQRAQSSLGDGARLHGQPAQHRRDARVSSRIESRFGMAGAERGDDDAA